MKRFLATLLALWIGSVPAHAGQMMLLGAGAPLAAGVAYQGPGDVVSGATVWGSCARVYSAAIASTATSLCDLVDSAAPTVTICTLRGTSTGFVDLTAYCPGSVTPAAKCAAATGGTCSVQKAYDQTGTGNHFTNVTAASQPRLLFSALGGLPGMTGLNANGTVLTSPNITQAQPFTLSTVYERTALFTSDAGILAFSNVLINIDTDATVNQVRLNAGNPIIQTANDSAFHAAQFVASGTANSAANTDGVDLSSQNGGTNAPSASALRLFRNNGGVSSSAVIMEGGFWPFAFNATQRGNLNTNQHSPTNGYNF